MPSDKPAEKKTTIVYDLEPPVLVAIQLPTAFTIFGINSNRFANSMQNSAGGTLRFSLEGDYILIRGSQDESKFHKIHASGVLMTFAPKVVEQ